jgi:hypothetical protein
MLQNIGPKRIESTHEENVKVLDRLTGAHERWLERAVYCFSMLRLRPSGCVRATLGASDFQVSENRRLLR